MPPRTRSGVTIDRLPLLVPDKPSQESGISVKDRTGFLSLPPELRLQIYDLYLDHHLEGFQDPCCFQKLQTLVQDCVFRLCRYIRTELLILVARHLVIAISSWSEIRNFQLYLGPRLVRRIHKILVYIRYFKECNGVDKLGRAMKNNFTNAHLVVFLPHKILEIKPDDARPRATLASFEPKPGLLINTTCSDFLAHELVKSILRLPLRKSLAMYVSMGYHFDHADTLVLMAPGWNGAKRPAVDTSRFEDVMNIVRSVKKSDLEAEAPLPLARKLVERLEAVTEVKIGQLENLISLYEDMEMEETCQLGVFFHDSE